MASAPPTPMPKPTHQQWLRALATYGLVVAFGVWCLFQFHRDLSQIDLTRLRAGWPAIFVVGALSLLNYALRALRWRMYLDRLGYRLPLRFVALTFMSGFAFTLSPGKLGEMVRARYYQPLGIPLAGLMAGFFVERLLDLLAMVLLALAALTELADYRSALGVATALVGLAIVMLALLPWSRAASWLSSHPAGQSKGARLLTSLMTMLGSARQFLTWKMLVSGLALGLLAWGLEAVGLKVLADVVSPTPLSLASATGIYAVAIIVGALSFLPGGLGSTEAVMAALLYSHGYRVPEAILLTLVCRLLTLWMAVLIGWVCVWLLRTHPVGRPPNSSASP